MFARGLPTLLVFIIFLGILENCAKKKFGLVFLIVEILDENVGGNELKKPIKLRMQKSAFYF